MNDDFLPSLIIGVLCLLAIFLILDQAGMTRTHGGRRASGLFAGAAGLLVTLYLQEHPDLLAQTNERTVIAILGILAAFLAALRNRAAG